MGEILLNPAVGSSDAGSPGPEPGEALYPGEELYPGAGALELTAKTMVGLAAASASSGGTLFLNQHVDMHAAEGVSGGTLAATAKTQVALSAAAGASGAAVQDTAPTYVGLSAAAGRSEAGTFEYPGEEMYPSEELWPCGGELLLFAPTPISLAAANATSGAASLTIRVKRAPGYSNPRQRGGYCAPKQSRVGVSNPGVLV